MWGAEYTQFKYKTDRILGFDMAGLNADGWGTK